VIVWFDEVNEDQGRKSDRHIEPEHRSPGDGLGQEPAQQRAYGEKNLSDTHIDCERAAAHLEREGAGNNRLRGRQHKRRTGPLQRSKKEKYRLAMIAGRHKSAAAGGHKE